MSFIDSSYFVGEINIPNASTDTSLTQAIDQYEKEILISLLGYKLYSLLIADLVNGIPVTQIYLDLVNGAEFTYSFRGEDITLKWEGLKNSAKVSLIAYYVFYKYVERDVTRYYGTGVSMAVPANGQSGWERVSSMNKLCAVWERMRELYGKVPLDYEPEKTLIGDMLPHTFNLDPSAYNFLFTNKDDYPDWLFTPIRNINVFNI
jgi:hypothetical protein